MRLNNSVTQATDVTKNTKLCDCTCHDNVVPLSCLGSCCDHAYVLRKNIPVGFDTFDKYDINNNRGEQ